MMKRILKSLLFAVAAVALVGLGLSAAYTHTVSEEVSRLRRESRSDIVYLRNRVRDLESELSATLLECFTSSSDLSVEAVDGDGVEDTARDGDETEAVTIPAHKSPETQASEEIAETDVPAALYLVTEHEGIIGVFDAAGELVRTVNVFTGTLPEAERKALQVGIPVYSPEEMRRLVEQYE